MAKRIVKFRLITYFEEVPNQVLPNGENVLVERTASLGAEVDLRPADEKRLDDLGALYSDDEGEAIAKGEYRGDDSEQLYRMRAGLRLASTDEAAIEGEGAHPGIDAETADAEEIAKFIEDNKLKVDETVALAGDTTEGIEKVIDAENLWSGSDPRKGVMDRLEAKLAAAAAAQA